MTMLYRVLYCSRNTILGQPQEVEANVRNILAFSRQNNARAGVTGGLFFSEGCFAQVLEGPRSAVEGAFERIQCDDRHSDVTVLQVGPIATRDFPDWSMAFTGVASPTSTALAGVTMANAFSGQSSAGDGMLTLLRSVVLRETEWLAPVPAQVA